MVGSRYSCESMEAGRIPARFEVLEEFSSNECEILLRARDTALDREVVLKLPGPGARRHILGKSRERTRVLREARALAKVHHEGVARILDVIETADGPLLVMEPLHGETLAARLERDDRLDADEVRRLGAALCDALGAVHAVGVVHRGVAEENVFLQPDGRPVLAGSVYAKPVDGVGMSSLNYRGDGSSAETAPALPSHPAPEQLAGQQADARSDIFGLGCVLYRALTGRDAFPAGGGDAPPAEPRKIVDVPKDLSAAIARCLSRSPMARFQTATAMREALLPASEMVRAGGRRWAMVTAASIGIVVVVALGYQTLTGSRGAPSGPQPADHPGTPAAEVSYSKKFDRSLALLIGIGKGYRGTGFEPLSTPRRDVEVIADVLRSQGWENPTVLVDGDATHDAIKSALARLEQARPDDRVLIYYAGHGEKHPVAKASGWILPCDAVSYEADADRKNWLRMDEFEARLREIPAKHAMVVLDCCYSGALPWLVTSARGQPAVGAGDSTPRRYYGDQYVQHPARIVLSSGQQGSKVWDGGGKYGEHSPFAFEFLKVLREESQGILASTMCARIKVAFDNDRLGQSPTLGYAEGKHGDFVLRLPDE